MKLLLINVTPINDAPVLVSTNLLETEEETAITVTTSDMTVTDIDNTNFSIHLQAGADYTFTGLVVTPVLDFVGQLEVPVTVKDSSGAESGMKLLLINVTQINDKPVIDSTDSLKVNEDHSVTIHLTDLNVTDVDGGHVYPTGFTLDVHPGNNYSVAGTVVTPALHFNDSLLVKVTVTDPDLLESDTMEVFVDVFPVNDAPSFTVDNAINIKEDEGPITWELSNIFEGPHQNEYEQRLRFVITSTNGASWYTTEPKNYLFNGDSTGATFTFEVGPNVVGEDILTITLIDDAGTDSSGVDRYVRTVPIVVSAQNDPPVVDTVYAISILEDDSIPIIMGDHFEASDVDLPADSLSFTLIDSTHYSIQGNTVVPDSNYFGPLVVRFVVSDNVGGSVSDTLNIEVLPVNDEPFFTVQDSLVRDEDKGLDTLVLYNVDAGGGETQPLGFSILNSGTGLIYAQNPKFKISNDSTYMIFEVAANSYGSEVVTIVLDDSTTADNGGDSLFTYDVKIVYKAVNDTIDIIGQDSIWVLEDSLIFLTPDSFNIVDVDSDTSGFVLSLIDNSLDYEIDGDSIKPTANFNGKLYVPVIINDGGDSSGVGNSATADTIIAVVHVIPVNDKPSFSMPNVLSISEDTIQIELEITNITAGPNEQGQKLGFTLGANPVGFYSKPPEIIYTQGASTAKLIFHVAPNKNGKDTIEVTLMDSVMNSLTHVETLILDVDSLNDNPVVDSTHALFVNEDDSVVVPRDSLFVTDVEHTWSTGFTLTLINGNNYTVNTTTSTVIPHDDFYGSLDVEFYVTDPDGGNSAQTTIKVHVAPINDSVYFTPPGDTIKLDEDHLVQTTFLTSIHEGLDYDSLHYDERNQDVAFGLTVRDSTLYDSIPTIAYVQDAAVATIYFKTVADWNGTDVWYITATDSFDQNGNAVDAPTEYLDSIVINVAAVNDSAVIVAVNPNTVLEDDTLHFDKSQITFYDIDNNDTTEVSIRFNPGSNFTIENDTVVIPDPDFFGTLYLDGELFDGTDKSVFNCTVIVHPVNDQPDFSMVFTDNIVEDSTEVTLNISELFKGNGSSDTLEFTQIPSFTIDSKGTAFYEIEPYVHSIADSTAKVSYKVKPDFFGIDTWTIYLKDGGDTINGGVDTISKSFDLTVRPVNDAPTMNLLSKIDIDEDGPQYDTIIANGVTAGPSNESNQYVGMILTLTGTLDSSFYTVYPTLRLNSGQDSTFSIIFRVAPNRTGTDYLTIMLQDAAGRTDGGDNDTTGIIQIEVGGVNDAPVKQSQDSIYVFEDNSVRITTDSLTIIDPDNDSADIRLEFIDSLGYSVSDSTVITPDPDVFGTLIVYVNIHDKDTTTFDSILVHVLPVNDAPTFTMDTLLTVFEDIGLVGGDSLWAKSISPGPLEIDSVWFNVTGINVSLYDSIPTIDSDGNISFKTKANINGRDTIWIQALDDGLTRTNNFGIDTSAYQQLILEFLSVNDKPTIITIKSLSVLEDDTLVIRKSDITVSDNDSGDDFTIILKDGTNHTVTDSLFIPTANFYHDIWTDIRVTDGIDTSTSYGIVVDVIPVNDAPSFDMGSQYTVGEDAGRIRIQWITNISSGPLEADRVDFHLTVSDLSLFDIEPYINRAGVLTFKSDTNVTGSVTIDIYAEDNGGLANGGVNRSGVQSMTLRITSSNDRPYLTLVDTLFVLEDSSIVIDGDTLEVRDVDSDSSDVIVIVYDTLWNYEYEDILDPSTIDYSVIDTNVSYDTIITVTYDTLINVNPIDTIITTHRDTSYEKQTRIPIDTNDYWKRGNTVFPNEDYNGDMYVRLRAYDGVHYSKYHYDQLVYVIPVNDLPVITQDSFNIFENTTGTIQSIPVTDVDDSLFAIAVVDTSSPFYITEDGELSIKDGRGLDFETKRIHSVIVTIDDAKDSIDIVFDTLKVSVENIYEKVNLVIDSVMIDSVIYPGEGTKIFTNSDSVFVYYTVDGIEKSDWSSIDPMAEDTNSFKIIEVDRWHSDETKDELGADTALVHWSKSVPEIIVEGITEPLDTIYTNDINYTIRAVIKTLDSNFRTQSEIFSYKPDLTEGIFTPMGVDTADIYGNYTNVPFIIILDTTAPKVDVVSPRDSSGLHQFQTRVDWTIDGFYQDTLNLDTVDVGYRVITRCATDRAGNLGCDSSEVYVDFNSVELVMDVENDMVDGRNPNRIPMDRMIANGDFDSDESHIGVSIVDYSRNEEVEIFSGPKGNLVAVQRDIGGIASFNETMAQGYFEFSDSIVAAGEVAPDDRSEISRRYEQYKSSFTPDRNKSANHVGPTLLLEISVPHMGGNSYGDGSERGGLRQVVPKTIGPNGEVILDSANASWEPIYFATVDIEVYYYDPIGQFVDHFTVPKVKIIKPENINDNGRASVRFETKPTDEGLKNSQGIQYATGVYLVSAETKVVVYKYKEASLPADVEAETNAYYNHGERESTSSEYLLGKWGYIHSNGWMH
ncbi:MAG: hypothetical protein OCD01_15860 [Fibrobacterales bacterium]